MDPEYKYLNKKFEIDTAWEWMRKVDERYLKNEWSDRTIHYDFLQESRIYFHIFNKWIHAKEQ